ncbi:U4/U6.U5 small nuclear ribonucleoprotein 27 kDa protein [Smittium culicis]|uniref:U4/U6.U5 small nuclear ribonucleoprotein 27 kDa protein n=1 Tax=Smittium culicis TaxID=133412 RepID=A0A1R1XJ30_9FUNG|nr:U4/U6.U5 small nuclear ribonucleoprotein 27 kDa protein [Smittium culicis]
MRDSDSSSDEKRYSRDRETNSMSHSDRKSSKSTYKTRGRSRSPIRDRKRSRSRDRDRNARDSRTRDTNSRERYPRDKDRTRRRERSPKERDPKAIEEIIKAKRREDRSRSRSPDIKVSEEASMAELMGFGSFDSTKNKPVFGNHPGSARIVKSRKYRQYMNRRGGFNRPLDEID